MDSDLTLFEQDDPTASFQQLVYDTVGKELYEECNVEAEPQLVALIRNAPLGPEFAHVASLDMSSQAFQEQLVRAEHDWEFDDVAALGSAHEVADFLADQTVTPSTKAMLELYFQ